MEPINIENKDDMNGEGRQNGGEDVENNKNFHSYTSSRVRLDGKR